MGLYPMSTENKLYMVDDVLRERATERDQGPLFAYPKKGLVDYEHFTAQDLDRFVDTAAKKLINHGLQPVDNASKVALFSHSNLQFLVTFLGLSRLGYAIAVFSPRLSVHAVKALLEGTQCGAIIYAPSLSAIIGEVKQQYRLEAFRVLDRSDFDSPHSSEPRFTRVVDGPLATTQPALIMHSSGSTGLPKWVTHSHQSCLANFTNGPDLPFFVTHPMYHFHGLFMVFRAIFKRRTVYLYNCDLPLTADNLVTVLEAIRPGLLSAVPYALKLLSEKEGGMDILKACKTVIFSGSMCPDDLGYRLVSNGVNLVGQLGTTETGPIFSTARPLGDNAWDCYRPLPSVKPYLYMKPIGSGSYECVILDGLKSKVVSNSDHPPSSFHTRDIYMPHPSIPDAWKYLGRLDDRITLLNGEKVLPLPIEYRVKEEPLVREAVVFGIDRAIPGLLVFKSEYARQISDQEFLECVMPAIEDANSRAEGFSQVSKEMVVVLSADTAFPQTDKSSIIRAQVYKVFSDIIEEAYHKLESVPEGTIQLDVKSLENWLTEVVQNRLGVQLVDANYSFYAAGVDSLQAIRLHNLIKRELDLGGHGHGLGQNVVFEYDTVHLLARHLFALRMGIKSENIGDIELMAGLITKYSHFEQHVPRRIRAPETYAVILTGVTGSLGAHLLARLLDCEKVDRVYCLVRARSPEHASTRVASSLEERDLQCREDKKSKIVAMPVRFGVDDLDLSPTVLEEMRQSTSHIIHAAWAVNFNLSTHSFEDHIKGTQSLLNLSLSTHGTSPAGFYFCSSISTATNTPFPASVAESHIEDLRFAQATGYARSKLVGEHIVRNAALNAGARARVLRIGQIVGDGKLGLWNDTEAIPLMLRSSLTLKALPDTQETCSWLPVDTCASTILDLANLSPKPHPSSLPSTSTLDSHPTVPFDPHPVYNLLNPYTFSWSHSLLPALRSAGLDFQSVTPSEWLKLLRESNQDAERNPTVKLTSFYARKFDGGEKAEGREGGGKEITFDTTRTREDSMTLRNAPRLVEEGYIEKFVAIWLKKWTGEEERRGFGAVEGEGESGFVLKGGAFGDAQDSTSHFFDGAPGACLPQDERPESGS